LTKSFINTLQNENYVLKYYDSNISCINAIKQGAIHTCIVFPSNFIIQNNASKTIEFYVDYTRIHLARVVLDSISKNVELRSTQLSVNLTENILDLLTSTRTGIQKDITTTNNIKGTVDEISTDADSIKSAVGNINLNVSTPSTTSLQSEIDSLLTKSKSVKTKATDVLEAGYALILDIGNSSTTADFEDALDTLNSTLNSTNYTLYDKNIDAYIASISSSLNDIKSKMSTANTAKTNIRTSIDSLREELTGLKTDLDSLKASQQKLIDDINKLQISSAETIVSPVVTEINSVVPETTKLSYLLPDLLVLIIMFIGLLLSSALLVLEKNSKAFFRNFTTPTPPQYFMYTTFLTSFFIILIQIVAILAIAFYFLRGPLFNNFYLTLAILCLVISFFTLIGMIIGYIFFNQETAMIASICVGSAMLLLSNLVLPLESMADMIQMIAKYNPFVVGSDLLRKSLLFDASFQGLKAQLLVILGIVVVLFVIIALVQRLSNIRFLRKPPHIKGLFEGNTFILHDTVLRNEKDLLNALKKMSDDDFKKDILKNKKDFVKGLRIIIHDARLRIRIKNRLTRNRMISSIEDYSKKGSKVK